MSLILVIPASLSFSSILQLIALPTQIHQFSFLISNIIFTVGMDNHNCSDLYLADLQGFCIIHCMYYVAHDFTLSREVNFSRN